MIKRKILITTFILTLICGLCACHFLFAQEANANKAEVAPATAPAQEPKVAVTEGLDNKTDVPPVQEETAIAAVVEPTKEDATAPQKPVNEEAVSKGITVNKEKISLDLKGIDIPEFFRILSMKMGLTIVPTKSVTGRINIFLNNLTFEDALDIILITQDLACDRHGSIIDIMTSSEYEKLYGRKYNEKRAFKSVKLTYAKPTAVFNALNQIKSDVGKLIVDEPSGTLIMIDIPEKLEVMQSTIKDLDRPPVTEVFNLQYAKPADMKAHLATAINAGTGEVFVDDRSSRIMVSDLPEKMSKIKRMVKAFDAETKEVYLEAEVVQINLKDEYQQGVDWEKVFNQGGATTYDIHGVFPVTSSWTPSPTLIKDYMKILTGTVAANKYNVTLNFLQTFGTTKIISSPRIASISGQEAKVMVGSREAYVTSSQSQAESTTVTSENVQFIDVGVKLNIVPTINDDGYITMKIKPEISSVRETLTTSLGSQIPIVDTSEAEAVVKVKDGAMVMIAGLRKVEKRKDTTGWPVLQNIPFVGALFGAKARSDEVSELIIFVTPHIIKGDKAASGAEPEKMIPADIIPRRMQENIMERAMEKNNLLPVQQSPAQLDIKYKAKGVKEY